MLEPIKVMLVEDDHIWREQLTSYLNREQDLVIVGTAVNREDAVHLARLSNAHVILMDLVLSNDGYEGIEAALDILEIKDSKIIMLTGIDEEKVIMDTFTAGAINYVTKAHYEDIPCAVRAAHFDRNYIHPDSAGVLLKGFRKLRKEQLSKLLTPAEREVLSYINQGHKQLTIQSERYTAQSTVKKHVNNILKKLKVSTSCEAARLAKRLGMID